MLTIAELKERLIGEGFMFTGLNDFMMENMGTYSAFDENTDNAEEDECWAFYVGEDNYRNATGEDGQDYILVDYTVDRGDSFDNEFGHDFGLTVTGVSWL